MSPENVHMSSSRLLYHKGNSTSFTNRTSSGEAMNSLRCFEGLGQGEMNGSQLKLPAVRNGLCG